MQLKQITIQKIKNKASSKNKDKNKTKLDEIKIIMLNFNKLSK